MYSVCCAVLLLLSLRVEGCHDLANFACDVTVASIEDLFKLNYTADAPAETIVCVDLEAGSRGNLTYTETCLPFSVVIRGNNSTLVCDNSEGDLGTNYTSFPLSFCNVSQVVIQELHLEQCMRPLKLEEVNIIVISFTNFMNFSPGGTLDIYNSPNVCIENSSIVNSTSQGYKTENYSGNSGGIAIGYSYPVPGDTPSITVEGCYFRNNSAYASGRYRFTVLEVLSTRVYNQRGGCMAFYFGASNYGGNVRIKNSQFIDCKAKDSGGGVYMFLGGTNSTHTVSISDTNFVGNCAQDGGGLEITHSKDDSVDNPNMIQITRCKFEGNLGNFGGGFKNIQINDQANSNYLSVKDTVFENNTATVGAAIYLQAVATVLTATLNRQIILEDCHFVNNTGRRGVVFVIGNVVTIKGDTHFVKSVGPALRILGTLAVLEGNVVFRENQRHTEGFSGALYLSSFGQIVLNRGTNITFLNNTGKEGACIVVRGQLIADAFKQQLYNPQCFLQYEIPTIPPHQWDVNVTFEGNSATIGPALLVSDITTCLWNDSSSPFFSQPNNLLENWPFLTVKANYIRGRELGENTTLSEATGRVVQTGIYNLDLTTQNTTAYPGQMVPVEVTARDQFDHITSGFVGIIASANSQDSISFEPSIIPISPISDGIEFQYFSTADGDEETEVVLDPFFTPDKRNKNFILHHSKCPAGFLLNNDSRCECQLVTDVVIFCKDHDKGLLLADGLWGASVCRGELAYYPCPPGYCKCTDENEDTNENQGCSLDVGDDDVDDKICRGNRTGVLCGKCVPPYGVGLLTNNCQKHLWGPTPHFWLFPIYVVALVITLVLLVKLGVHLPTILRGFIFYIQIAPIAVTYFPDSFELSTEILYCISSTVALYLPFDFTFREGMAALESHAYRYIAPLIALVVVPLAARVRHHRFKYWHGIWTIILLMYVMTLETSVSLLLCPTLNVDNCSDVKMVWFFDGNVKCWERGHIPLGIVAVVSLVAQALLVLFVAAVTYHKTLRKKYVKFEQLERFSLVIAHGIKHEYKWWPIMELGCRYVFVVLVVALPGYVVVPLVIAIAIFVLQTLIHPYKSKLANYTESLLFLWLVCLLGLGNTTELQTGNHKGWSDALLYIPVACALVVMVVHCVLLARKSLLPYKDKIKEKLKMTSSESVFKLQRTLTSSYVYHSRKQWKVINQQREAVTETVVGLDDPPPMHQEVPEANTAEEVELHTL